MKRILAGLTVIFALAGDAWASPYFRVYGWDYKAKTLSVEAFYHPQPVAGALINPADLRGSRMGALLPIVFHSPSDGCLLPQFVCEDWSPLAVGGSMNAGKLTFDTGPLFNILPWMVSGAQRLAPARFQPLLANTPSAVTFSAGPMWEYRQIENKGYFLVFTGLALHF